MEVHVRNVPKQSTHKMLENFLKPHLQILSIKSVHYVKHKDKTNAFLTFLYAADGESFLSKHGQSRIQGVKSRTRALLFYLNKPIYFEKSTHVPDPTTLRGLEKEMKDREMKHSKPDDYTLSSKFEPINWDLEGFSCGTWSYHHGENVFISEIDLRVNGTARFGQRGIILSLDNGQRVDFRYAAVIEVIFQKTPPTMTLSLSEPPRFFEKTLKPSQGTLTTLLSELSINSLRNIPERVRVPALSTAHQEVAGNCLVYRIALSQIDSTDYDKNFKKLQRLPHLEQPLRHNTRVWRRSESLIHGKALLQAAFANSAIELPFEIIFQTQRLVSNNYLPPSTVLGLLPEITQILERSGQQACVAAIHKLFTQICYPSFQADGSMYLVQNLIEYLRENENLSLSEAALRIAVEDDGEIETSSTLITHDHSDNEVMIHRARITPTGLILSGPEPESNNRVLRKYSKHHNQFLRVTFSDEDSRSIRPSFKVSAEKILHGRFKKILNEGINIAGRHYEFLGFSHSSLRMQTCWFMAPFIFDGSLIWRRQVIRDLGDFANIQCPAKCAARIGQAFSDTPTTVKINSHNTIQDVERNGRVFSDGVGTISEAVRDLICRQLKKKHLIQPTCFQIRYKGAKGMLALDSRLQGESVNLRPSMIKFEGSTSDDLEICDAAHRPLPLYLNRQLIKILEDMGVEDDFFLDLQAEEVRRLRMITENPYNASSFLKRQKIGEAILLPWLINELYYRDLDFQHDGFLRDVVEISILFELRQLKHKTRIPVEKGWHLHGIMDETNFLKEGEVFCSVIVDRKVQVVLGTDIIVSRSPALHPGDVQVANGVQPPPDSPLWKIYNCICFSQRGNRDLPSQLGGGDLDGDRFCIIFDERARVKRTFPPADYPRQMPMNIGRPVEKEDMVEFFVQFMEADQLGQIAVQHRVLADARDLGTNDPDCKILAEMHSTAVDFSKTGIPVNMLRLPRRPKFRPDFEAPGPHVIIEQLEGATFAAENEVDPGDQDDEDDDLPRYRYYESRKILGKLYREIDEQDLYKQIQKREAGITNQSTVISAIWASVQKECRLIQWEYHLDWAHEIRDMYEINLAEVMLEYSDHPLRPLSELEAFAGNILGKTGAQSRIQHDTSVKMRERIEENNTFIVNCIVRDGSKYSKEALERSMACLGASLAESGRKKHNQLLSFKYLAAAVCLRQVQRFFDGL